MCVCAVHMPTNSLCCVNRRFVLITLAVSAVNDMQACWSNVRIVELAFCTKVHSDLSASETEKKMWCTIFKDLRDELKGALIFYNFAPS